MPFQVWIGLNFLANVNNGPKNVALLDDKLTGHTVWQVVLIESASFGDTDSPFLFVLSL